MQNRIDPDNQPIKPFQYVDKNYKEKPFSYIDNDINSSSKFVITRLTDNGAYVKGGMLYFRLNGVDIFAELDEAIYVNKENNSITIKKSKMDNLDDSTIPPEERQYIILQYDYSGDEDGYSWNSMTGRTITYEYIKANIDLFNPDESIVLTDNVPIKDALTVTQFVKYLKNANLVPEDDFDIDIYSEM